MNCKALPLALAVLAPLALAHCSDPSKGPPPLYSPTLDRALALAQLMATNGTPRDKVGCIEAVQGLNDPRAAAIIEEALHDPNWNVRFAAAMASGQLKGTYASNTRPTLNTMATQDSSGSVRAACIYALRQMGDTTHMSDLATLLDSPDNQSAMDAAFVLGMMHDPSAIPLLQMHRDKPEAVRDEVTAALARLGDEPSQQVVVGWAVSKFADDEWKAMVICGDLPPSMGRSPLLLGLDNVPVKLPADVKPTDKLTIENLTARRQLTAAASLAKMGDDSGYGIAVMNLSNQDPSLRALAIRAIGAMRDRISSRDAPHLESILSDPSDDVKIAAAATIIKLYARAQAGQ